MTKELENAIYQVLKESEAVIRQSGYSGISWPEFHQAVYELQRHMPIKKFPPLLPKAVRSGGFDGQAELLAEYLKMKGSAAQPLKQK